MALYRVREIPVYHDKDGNLVTGTTDVVLPDHCWPETKSRFELAHGTMYCKILWHTAHKTSSGWEYNIYYWMDPKTRFKPGGTRIF